MKQTLALLLAALLLLPAAVVAQQTTLVGQGTSLTAELLRYEPNPAEPGDLVTVNVVLTNEGGEVARGVELELVDSYPFSAADPNEAAKQITSIPGQQSTVTSFLVLVDKDAPEGTAFLKVRYKPTNSAGWKESLLSLDITTN
ncbi:MAG: hypothetical protein HC945_04405, partial [Nitrosarchaeum sp.]|nr:hypothetical protein [Nitrosarchaeum sp.]